MAQFNTGSVKVLNADQNRWVLAGALTTGNIFAGNLVKFDGEANLWFTVATIIDAITFETVENYNGAKPFDTFLPYVVTRDFTPNLGIPEATQGDRNTADIFTRAMRILDVKGLGLPIVTTSRVLQQSSFTPVYDLAAGLLATNLSMGVPSAPITLNVPDAKQLSVISLNLQNSGQGKLFAFQAQVEATGAAQDVGEEPVRAFIGRAINSGTGNRKTTGLRIGASGAGSNASPLFGVDADVTLVATSPADASAVYGATLFGNFDDKASFFLMASPDGARASMGVGSSGPIDFNAAAFRAYMGAGSGVSARAYQVLNSAAVEIAYIDKLGAALLTGLTIDPNLSGAGAFEYRGRFGANKYATYQAGEVNTFDKGHLNRGHRSTTSPSAVASGDVLANYYFQGHDGSTFITAAYLSAIVDGAVSAGQVPGRLEFNTRQGGVLGPRMVLGAGLHLAAPTGADQGAGTINVSVNLFKNGTAYTNPDFVLEHWATGRIVMFADREGADRYPGLMSLPDVEAFAREHFVLPRLHEARTVGGGRVGLFDGGDALLASLEESYLYLFDHERRLRALEARA